MKLFNLIPKKLQKYLGYVFFITLVFYNSPSAYSQASTKLIPTCLSDPKIQEARSKELAQLLELDQKDREHYENNTVNEINNNMNRDLIRRQRVGAIMAEGCLKTADDYAAASLIYQHGEVPDHYYQAFTWANKAVALGDVKQKELAAMTLDRYLISIGKKQLFGSQFQASSATGGCFCIEPVESSFPDSMRVEYLGKKLIEQYNLLSKLNSKKTNCSNSVCPMKLSSTLRGSIIGFW